MAARKRKVNREPINPQGELSPKEKTVTLKKVHFYFLPTDLSPPSRTTPRRSARKPGEGNVQYKGEGDTTGEPHPKTTRTVSLIQNTERHSSKFFPSAPTRKTIPFAVRTWSASDLNKHTGPTRSPREVILAR